jgi:hypothetical protein
MMAFIDDHRSAYGVESICIVLPIAPSTYYVYATRRADPRRLPARQQRDALLSEHIRRVWEENFKCTARLRSGYPSAHPVLTGVQSDIEDFPQ